MDYIEKRNQDDHSLFFLVITCLLIFSTFSSVLIDKNAKIIHSITESFYAKNITYEPITIEANKTQNNKVEYNEFKNGTINEVFIRGKLQECLDKLINDNKISQNEAGKLLDSINNLYEIDNILNLKTEINLVNKENENSLQDVKIKLDDFRYLAINKINDSLVVNKIFDTEGIQNQLETSIEEKIEEKIAEQQSLNSINNNKKILEIVKTHSISIQKIKLDSKFSLLKYIPQKSLINFVDKKTKTIKLVTLEKKIENGKNTVVYFALENKGKSLKYYRHSDGKFYSSRGQSIIQQSVFSSPLSGGYRISSPFGERIHPILRYRRMHTGVDLAAAYGTPIKSAGDGRVEFVGKKGGYGRYILINHGNGYKTGYGHLSAFSRNLKNGLRVSRGQLIGKVGSSGLSSGPHLHYELIKDKKFTNPLTASPKASQAINRKDYKRFASEVKNIEYMVHQLKELELKKAQIV